MTIRQQYANEELVHKLRSMLNDLPALRTRAIKKLEHWREAAIKRLLARQRELEKTLLDKFERLEFDTQLFVEKSERRKAQQQRRWQSEPLDYLNKNEIDRISTNLRSIREELEQSKLLLVGNANREFLSDDPILGKLPTNSQSKSPIHKTYDSSTTSDDLGVELKRVLEICTSPQSSLSADELSPLQSLAHTQYSYDAKPKQTTAKKSTTFEQKHHSSAENINRRHSRLINNVSIEQSEDEPQETISSQTLNTADLNEDSVRRLHRLREIRKNLKNKYSDQTNTKEERVQSIHIPVERIQPDSNVSTPLSRLHSTPIDTRDRRYRSRTLEVNQTRSVDNQIYGNSNTKTKEQTTSSRHRHGRRSSDDLQEKQFQYRKKYEINSNSADEIWFDVGQENWTNLLEHGWRPTADASGVQLISFDDSDDYSNRSRKKNKEEITVIDLYEQISRNDYISMFDKLDFAYTRTIDLGNEFWRFLEISENQQLCLYHQLNKLFIMYKPETSLVAFPWPYDGIVDISWSHTTNTWAVATQTQIIICNRSFSKIYQSIDINGDWPKRITTCRSSIFHTYKMPPSSLLSPTYRRSSSLSSFKERPQFLLERFDYKLNSICQHILESSTIWDIEADDVTDHLAVLCDVALLLFDYQLNLLRQIEVTGFKVSRDHFGGWLVADYNASCIWQIRRNEYLKANKILHVERPWTILLERSNWTLITLSETQNRAKRLLFFPLKNVPNVLEMTLSSSGQSQQSHSTSSSISESLL